MIDEPRNPDLPSGDDPSGGDPPPRGPEGTPQDEHDSQAMFEDAETIRSGDDDQTLIQGPGSVDPSLGAGMIGRTIDGYTITGVVGSGGMGTVYLARQQSPDRLVALKMMRPGMANPSMLRRFQYETEALARVHVHQKGGIPRVRVANQAWRCVSVAGPVRRGWPKIFFLYRYSLFNWLRSIFESFL